MSESLPMLTLQGSPQQFADRDTGQLMRQVILCCLPGVLIATWFFGIGTLLNISLAMVAALALEAGSVRLRGQSPTSAWRDNSALVTAVLLGIALPPGAPWWLVIAGVAMAIVVAKQVFGGLGQNPFNPAMCGYAFLLLSFPLEMTGWRVPGAQPGSPLDSPLSPEGLLASLHLLLGLPPMLSGADGMAMATPLLEQKLAARSVLAELVNADAGWEVFLDRRSGAGWELVNLGYLAGGLLLLARRVISWHIPLSLLSTVLVLSLVFYSDNSSAVYGTPALHLFGTATMLGAFFIATDPVSSPSTPRGKLLYGVIIGGAIYAIRVWGSYLDSVAFAVLFGNLFSPLIDRLSLPRIYGKGRSR